MSKNLILFVKYCSKSSIELCELLKSKKYEVSEFYKIKVINIDNIDAITKKQLSNKINKIPSMFVDGSYYVGYNEISTKIKNISQSQPKVSSPKKTTEDMLKDIMNDQENSSYGEGLYENKSQSQTQSTETTKPAKKNIDEDRHDNSIEHQDDDESSYGIIEDYILGTMTQ